MMVKPRVWLAAAACVVAALSAAPTPAAVAQTHTGSVAVWEHEAVTDIGAAAVTPDPWPVWLHSVFAELPGGDEATLEVTQLDDRQGLGFVAFADPGTVLIDVSVVDELRINERHPRSAIALLLHELVHVAHFSTAEPDNNGVPSIPGGLLLTDEDANTWASPLRGAESREVASMEAMAACVETTLIPDFGSDYLAGECPATYVERVISYLQDEADTNFRHTA